MVSKERLAGFIDAVIAVVMTVMLLEFDIPKSGSILEFLHENLVYLIAYALSFIYVVTSWFNQQYMLKLAENITRKIYRSCMIWVASLSLLPVLAAWTGRTINLFDDLGLHSPKAPALLFCAMIFLWGYAYLYMSRCFIADNPDEKAQVIKEMEVLNYLSSPIYPIGMIITLIITFFYPPFVFIYTSVEMIYAFIISNNHKEIA